MYTILIVDDEANLLEVLAVALENMGYGTVTAETAEEALAVLEEREVHLVLSDLRLPGLSGRELMEKVKAANPDLPVVIMTAYASLKEAVEIIKEGAFDYTVKPFELDALVLRALELLAGGHAGLDLHGEVDLLRRGEQRDLADLLQVHADRIAGEHGHAGVGVALAHRADFALAAHFGQLDVDRRLELLFGDALEQVFVVAVLRQTAFELIVVEPVGGVDHVGLVVEGVFLQDVFGFDRSFRNGVLLLSGLLA